MANHPGRRLRAGLLARSKAGLRSRRYIFIPHGGGVTPVVQTVDTDVNQPVEADYIAEESTEHLQQMQDGALLPRCKAEKCIDIMYGVLSKKALHLAAADGYKKTGRRLR